MIIFCSSSSTSILTGLFKNSKAKFLISFENVAEKRRVCLCFGKSEDTFEDIGESLKRLEEMNEGQPFDMGIN